MGPLRQDVVLLLLLTITQYLELMHFTANTDSFVSDFTLRNLVRYGSRLLTGELVGSQNSPEPLILGIQQFLCLCFDL